MLNCFITNKSVSANIIPITLIPQKDFASWLEKQTDTIKNWIIATEFRPDIGSARLMPDTSGNIARVFCCVSDLENFWDVGNLPALPNGVYEIEMANEQHAIAWGLGAYQFTRYKKPLRSPAQLYLPSTLDVAFIQNSVSSLYLVRDWINTPTDDMGPTQFADVAAALAKEHGASFKQIVGEDLLQQNYASIYTVGRASDDAPRLIDIRWGDTKHRKLTLVGKGVCFDSGGLDLKPAPHMLLMKKDMAGGAHVLGLARMIMQAKLPICLRVLIPVVENVISGNAYRPGDVIKSRKGITIEVGNTDAEGRVILADALTEAVNEKPDLVIDMSTLTGAARVALGTELPAVFSNHDEIVNAVISQGEKERDPMWRLPLYAVYREYINSAIADINNNSSDPYAGAITAALFLKEFVPDDIPWLHFDMMAWNLRQRPGHPIGGEAMTLRALFGYLREKFV